VLNKLNSIQKVLSTLCEIKKDTNMCGDARSITSCRTIQARTGVLHCTYFFLLVSRKVCKAIQLQSGAITAGDTTTLTSILKELRQFRSDVEFDELLQENDRHVEEYGLVKPVKWNTATTERFAHRPNKEKATVKLKQGYFQMLDLIQNELDALIKRI